MAVILALLCAFAVGLALMVYAAPDLRRHFAALWVELQLLVVYLQLTAHDAASRLGGLYGRLRARFTR